MKYIGIIPARYDSSRFPGKPLQLISGKSMIQRVYEQCAKASVLDDLLVATDDQRIFAHVEGFGGKAIITSPHHKCGTERCNEAVKLINEQAMYSDSDVLINIQGDEPLINPAQLKILASCFKKADTNIATLIKKIEDPVDISNSNVIKVVCNKFSEAQYFSRSPIPFLRGCNEKDWLINGTFYKHIGIYAYRIGVLNKITKMDPTPLELSESLEQLRWLENGLIIKTALTEFDSHSVDVPDDISTIEKLLIKE